MGTRDKAIIFSIFDECKVYTLDRYWITWFSNFACNKFPSGVKYDPKNRTLIIKSSGSNGASRPESKTKTLETINLPDESSQVFTVMMKIMKDKLGLRSTRDLKIPLSSSPPRGSQTGKGGIRLGFPDRPQGRMRLAKGSIDNDFKKNTKYVRDQLISNYELTLRNKYNLTAAEYNRTVSLIKLGFQFKSISPDNIVFENGEITDISGLVFNEKTRKFSIPKYGTKISPKTCKKASIDRFGARLDKFINDNNDRLEKYNYSG